MSDVGLLLSILFGFIGIYVAVFPNHFKGKICKGSNISAFRYLGILLVLAGLFIAIWDMRGVALQSIIKIFEDAARNSYSYSEPNDISIDVNNP